MLIIISEDPTRAGLIIEPCHEKTNVLISDTQSSDSSAEVMRESGRTFQSLMLWGMKLFL